MITAIFMPDMDGIELIMFIKKNYPAASIVAMSGGLQLSTTPMSLYCLATAKTLGVGGVVNKPFEGGDLLYVINQVLGKN